MLVLFFSVKGYSNTPKEVVKAATTKTKVQTLVQADYVDTANDKIEKSAVPEYDLLFYIKDKHKLQGITFFNKNIYCGFDVGGGNGKIVKYNMSGKIISETSPMRVGHCADIGYRSRTNKMYITNGGGHNLTHVYVVDYNKSLIINDLNYGSLGTSALLAIDNVHDYLILHTVLKRGDVGNPRFTIISLKNMKILNSFNVDRQGIPQGLEADGKHIYLYTNNKITVYNYDGSKVAQYHVNKRGESEGITIASEYGKSYLAIGYNSPNRIYSLFIKETQSETSLKLTKLDKAISNKQEYGKKSIKSYE